MDDDKVSVLTLLNLSAAFDIIDHDVLLHRLQHVFGIQGTALSWFKSYLTDRQQVVSVNGKQSKSFQRLYDVPQGSVLSPILFIMYTQPLTHVIKRTPYIISYMLMTLNFTNLAVQVKSSPYLKI